MEMPPNDHRNDLSIYAHVQMVAMSLYYLKMKLRDVLKTSTEPDDMLPNALRLVSKELADTKAELDKNTDKLERLFVKLRRSRTH